MKKPVPDPPPRLSTVHTPFSLCNDSHKPLFAVCPGVDIEDALAHLAMSLKSAFETNVQVCELAEKSVGDLAWTTYHALEIARALTESLLQSVTREHAPGN